MKPYVAFWRNKRVAITGGAGLIGSAFVQELLAQGAQVSTVQHCRPIPFGNLDVIKGDLLQPDICDAVCKGAYAVIHAAGVSGGSKKVTCDLISMFTDNLSMNTRLLESARRAGVQRYLFISNSSVYGQTEALLKEKDAWVGTGTAPENETGVMKRTGEAQCRIYSQFTGMRIAIVRAANAYGPRDNFEFESSHVLPALIRRAVERQDPYCIWGSGTVIRDFVFARDVALAGLLLLERSERGECLPVNIGTGCPVTILDAARLILTIVHYTPMNIVFDTSAPATSPAKRLDLSRMQQLGFKPTVSLEQGLRETIDWFRQYRI